MQFLTRFVSRNLNLPKYLPSTLISSLFKPLLSNPRFFFSSSAGDGGDNFRWDSDSLPSWSTGISEDQFDGESVGHQLSASSCGGGGGGYQSNLGDEWREKLDEIEKEGRKHKEMVDKWEEREWEVNCLLKQVEEPGARGSYLKDSEKSEMYKKFKESPEVYTVEKLASEYRIMRQRVHAILWLKQLEEEEEQKRGEPFDDAVELLLDTFPEFFSSHDREFHVASLPYKPDFKVMPEGWDGTTRDPDEVHYEISKKEDDMLYEEFLQKFKFNTMKFENKVKVHKYARRRSSDGWNFTVEMLGKKGKRGDGGGWKFVSRPDGSTRPLNDMEKMYVKRERPRRRRKILP